MAKETRFGQSHRLLRVGEELRHALADVLARGDLRDPALDGVAITVTEIKPSPDLRHATVYVMPLGGGETTPVLEALTRSAGFIGHQMAQRVRLKYFPRLIFRLDETFKEAWRIEVLLRDPRVARDLEVEDEVADGDDDAEDRSDDKQ